MRLEGGGGGEGPAASAVALVLDGSDNPLIAPVNGSGQLTHGLVACRALKKLELRLEGLLGGSLVETEERLLLLGGHIRELVDAQGVGRALVHVMGTHTRHLLQEDALVLAPLGGSHLVALAVLLHEVCEGHLRLGRAGEARLIEALEHRVRKVLAVRFLGAHSTDSSRGAECAVHTVL